ncbi:MAG: hypothetical protein J6129_01405 [Bacteroidaceae bacterium]|nr:hypothetical protein [Bacteroidaceae bacterium]
MKLPTKNQIISCKIYKKIGATLTGSTPKKGQTAKTSTASTLQKGQTAQPSTASTLQKETADKLHALIDGKQGKQVALAIYCAAQLGLITQTDYRAVCEEFGDIGSRQNYYKYISNPQRFTELEIEATKNFLTLSKNFLTPSKN